MEEAPQWYLDSWDLYSMGDQPGLSHKHIDCEVSYNKLIFNYILFNTITANSFHNLQA